MLQLSVIVRSILFGYKIFAGHQRWLYLANGLALSASRMAPPGNQRLEGCYHHFSSI